MKLYVGKVVGYVPNGEEEIYPFRGVITEVISEDVYRVAALLVNHNLTFLCDRAHIYKVNEQKEDNACI